MPFWTFGSFRSGFATFAVPFSDLAFATSALCDAAVAPPSVCALVVDAVAACLEALSGSAFAVPLLAAASDGPG